MRFKILLLLTVLSTACGEEVNYLKSGQAPTCGNGTCQFGESCVNDVDCSSDICKNNKCQMSPDEFYKISCRSDAPAPCIVKVFHPVLPAKSDGNWVEGSEVQLSINSLCSPNVSLQSPPNEVVHVYAIGTVNGGRWFDRTFGQIMLPDQKTTKSFSEAASPNSGAGTITRTELQCADFGF